MGNLKLQMTYFLVEDSVDGIDLRGFGNVDSNFNFILVSLRAHKDEKEIGEFMYKDKRLDIKGLAADADAVQMYGFFMKVFEQLQSEANAIGTVIRNSGIN